MNSTEAIDVNTLLHWLFETADSSGTVPSHEEGRDAAAYLAGRAHKALGAGIRPEQVTKQWHWADSGAAPGDTTRGPDR